jgi:hypothetical protein
MSYKTIINSKSGLKVERLGENLWSAQPKPYNLFTTPKIQFSLGPENQIEVKRYDLLRPSLIYSVGFALIFLICEFVFELNIGLGLGYLIIGSTVFHFGLMLMLIYVTKLRIQNQVKK